MENQTNKKMKIGLDDEPKLMHCKWIGEEMPATVKTKQIGNCRVTHFPATAPKINWSGTCADDMLKRLLQRGGKW